MKLKEFEEVFEKVLCEKDYSELEKAVNYGLKLERNGVSQILDGGSESLQKLTQELPSLYDKFEKLSLERKRNRDFEPIRIKSKGFSDFVPGDSTATNCFHTVDLMVSGIATAVGFIMAPLIFFTPSSVMIEGAKDGVIPFLVTGIVGSPFLANDMHHMVREPDHYYHPLVLPFSAAMYGVHKAANGVRMARNWKNREQRRMKKLEKVKEGLVKELRSAYHGKPDYSLRWFERECGVLSDMLANADEAFALRFFSVGEQVLPYHRLELHKEMESCLSKDYQKTPRTVEKSKGFLCKLGLAEKAKIHTEELKEKLRRDLEEKRKEHKKISKEHKELSEGFEKLLQDYF